MSTINELIDMLVAFEFAGPAAGNRVAVLGGAGGETVESADGTRLLRFTDDPYLGPYARWAEERLKK